MKAVHSILLESSISIRLAPVLIQNLKSKSSGWVIYECTKNSCVSIFLGGGVGY